MYVLQRTCKPQFDGNSKPMTRKTLSNPAVRAYLSKSRADARR